MNLNLPKQCFVNKFIPKSKFFNKVVINTKLKNQFSESISRITWKYKLAESTINISKTDIVEEIQIFQIDLKQREIPKNIIKIIDKTIPYPILFVFVYNDDFAFGISLKNEIPYKYFFSEWGEEIKFDFTGNSIEHIYQKIITAFIKDVKGGKFEEIIQINQTKESLEKEVLSLKNKIKKEKQFNKQIIMHQQLKKVSLELEKINNL